MITLFSLKALYGHTSSYSRTKMLLLVHRRKSNHQTYCLWQYNTAPVDRGLKIPAWQLSSKDNCYSYVSNLCSWYNNYTGDRCAQLSKGRIMIPLWAKYFFICANKTQHFMQFYFTPQSSLLVAVFQHSCFQLLLPSMNANHYPTFPRPSEMNLKNDAYRIV